MKRGVSQACSGTGKRREPRRGDAFWGREGRCATPPSRTRRAALMGRPALGSTSRAACRGPPHPATPGSGSCPASPSGTDSSARGSATPTPPARSPRPRPQTSPDPGVTETRSCSASVPALTRARLRLPAFSETRRVLHFLPGSRGLSNTASLHLVLIFCHGACTIS